MYCLRNISFIRLYHSVPVLYNSYIMDGDNLFPAKTKKPFRISIEGNIGCGKSTFISHFSQFPDVDTQLEPVHLWKNVQGHNLLSLLYQDLKKWNLPFQSYVQLTRLQVQTQACSKNVRMFERSIQNNRYCFIEMAHKNGLLSTPEYAVLCEWYDFLQKNMDFGIDLIVYLRSSPEVAFKRIQQRDRQEEKTVPLEYLQEVHEAYESWLVHSGTAPAPVWTIDANHDLRSMKKQYSKVENFLKNQCLHSAVNGLDSAVTVM